MAYPGVFYSDDGQILRAMQTAADNGALIMMHAENGIAIDVLIAQALAAGRDRPRSTTASPGREVTEDEATHRAIHAGPARRRAAVHRPHVRPSRRSPTVAAARDQGCNVFAETCPQYLYLSLEEHLARPGFEGAKYVCSTPLRPRRGPPGRAVAGPAHQRPLGGVAPTTARSASRSRRSSGSATSPRSRTGFRGVEHRMDLIYQASSTATSAAPRWVEIVLRPRRPGCSGSTPARARSPPAPTPTSSSTTRTPPRRCRRRHPPHERRLLVLRGHGRSPAGSTPCCPGARSSSTTASTWGPRVTGSTCAAARAST